jgi:hypothetical protein
VAALYDMLRFDEENARRRPEFLKWMTTVETLNGEVVFGRGALSCRADTSPRLLAV